MFPIDPTQTAAPPSQQGDPITDSSLTRVSQQLSKLRTAKPNDWATLTPDDVEDYVRQETQNRFGRNDAFKVLGWPNSGGLGYAPPAPTDPQLISAARDMYVLGAKARAAGQDVTSADQAAFIAQRTNGQFNLQDALAALRGSTAPDASPNDPVMIKAARQIMTARVKARQKGVDLTPEDQEDFMREETQGRYGLRDASQFLSTIDPNVTTRNMSRSYVQGILGNFGDEILGRLPSWLGGGAGPEEDMRARGEMFSRTHPVANAVGSAAGALSGGLAIPAGEAATVGGAVARGAATGAASGAIAGAGAGETTDDRLRQAATGATVGGALGGAIPGVIASARYFGNPAIRAAARLSNAIDQSGGISKLEQAASDMSSAGRGNDMMLADLSPQLRQTADFAANHDGDGSVLVPLAERLRARQSDASDRLLNDARDAFGGDADAGATRTTLEASRRAWANGPTGYGGIDPAAQFDLAPLTAALNKPTVASAWNQAKLAGDLVAESPLDKLLTRISASNPGVNKSSLAGAAKAGLLGDDFAAAANNQSARPVTFDDLQQLRRTLGDRVDGAYAKGNGGLATSYKTIQSAVDDALENGVPGYRALNQQYATRKGLERALQAGQDAWSQVDTRGLASQIATLSPDELTQFRTGMASQLTASLRSASTNRDEATRLVNGSPALNDKLRTVFGTEDNFHQFMQGVGAESQLAKLRGAVGGSETARRLSAYGFDPSDLLIHSAVAGPVGAMRGVLRGVAGTATRAVRQGTARELGPMLMTQGLPQIDALLSRLRTPAPLVSKIWTSALPTVAGRAPSLFDQF